MSDTAPKRRRGRGSAALVAALALAAVAASTAASAALSGQPAPPSVEAQLQAEIDGMREAGMPADHPKVRMLEEDLAELRAASERRPRRDRGAADIGALVAEGRADEAAGPQAAAAEAAAEGEPLWESGPVECEPVPGLLSAADVAGATCVSVPQPDGTNRYVALGPDGVARTVLFGANGDVRRLADAPLPAAPAPGEAVAATPEGDVQVGGTVVDVG
jgi:hypothetical protein